MTHDQCFSFNNVSEDYIVNLLKKLKVKKATGNDNIPAKLLNYGADVLCHPLQSLINKCLNESVFPMNAKKKQLLHLCLKK